MAKPMSFKEIMPLELFRGDFIIMVMGPTGSGKSNFILQLLAGRPKPQSLESVTSKIKALRIFNPPVKDSPISSLVVVDTPGFDDTNISDIDILDMAAEWLRKSYSDGFPLAGLVYCHRITDNRIKGSSNRNLRMFAKLTGSDALDKVILLQTVWDCVDPSVGQSRDEELRKNFWKPMIDSGAKVERFSSEHKEAWDIVSRCAAAHENSLGSDAILLQDEMVHARKRIAETSAGKELYNDYQRLLDRQREQLRKLQSQEISQGMRAVVEREIRELDANLEKTFQDMRKLKIPFFRKVILMFKGTPKTRPIDIEVRD